MRKIYCVALSVVAAFSLVGCKKATPESCKKHKGAEVCKKCGLDYYDGLKRFVLTSDKSTEDNGEHTIAIEGDNYLFELKYSEKESEEGRVFMDVVDYQNGGVFLIDMNDAAGEYDWSYMFLGGKTASGVFTAKEVKGKTYALQADFNSIPEGDYQTLKPTLDTYVGKCIEYTAKAIEGNSVNLTVADLGFVNYPLA